MCVVSMVHEHFQTDWWKPNGPINPQPVVIGHPEWTLERWNEYQELLKKAAEYDKRTGQEECPDPAKDAKYKEIAEFIAKKYGLQEAK